VDPATKSRRDIEKKAATICDSHETANVELHVVLATETIGPENVRTKKAATIRKLNRDSHESANMELRMVLATKTIGPENVKTVGPENVESDGSTSDEGVEIDEARQDMPAEMVSRPYYGAEYLQRCPPSIDDARDALVDLRMVLKPTRSKGYGYKHAGIDDVMRNQLETMRIFLVAYVDGLPWMAASMQATQAMEKGRHSAAQVRKWTKAYIRDRHALPINKYSKKPSQIDDEGFAYDLQVHLQEIGKYLKAMDIVTYLATPEMKEKYGLTGTISLTTAKRWMRKLDYRWTKMPNGQYVDGHEREDVVTYRQNVFLPAWMNAILG
jgi:hypothetical protein